MFTSVIRLLLLCAFTIRISKSSQEEGGSAYHPGPEEGASKEQTRPSVVLQLAPEFFEYPGLKDIYAAFAGGTVPHDREIYLQLMPKKREVPKTGGNVAQFALRLNPVIPRNPITLKNYTNLRCQERKQEWCLEMPSPDPVYCTAVDTPPPQPTTCGPRKPSTLEKAFDFCTNGPHMVVPKDPCEECAQQNPPPPTKFVACYSMPPPTAVQRLKYCSPTTMPCYPVPCTYMMAEHLPRPAPPTPPPCDASLAPPGPQPFGPMPDAALKPATKYYILVKRSPGSWVRRKRDGRRQRRRFRIVTEYSRR